MPWATSATTSAEFTDVLAGMPKVAEWLDALLHGLRDRIGAPSGTASGTASSTADPRFSPHLVLAFSTPELVGPGARTGDQIRWVGPSVTARPAPPGFPGTGSTPPAARSW